MTTTTAVRSRAKTRPVRASRRGAFTLVEIMVSVGISAIVMAAMCSAFIFLAGSSLRMGQYSEMEQQSRGLLQQFSQDARQASNAAWTDVNTLNLTIDGNQVTYVYDPAQKTFARTQTGSATRTMATGLTSFQFRAFQITGTELPLSSSPTTVGASTKMIQINIELAQGNQATGSTSGQIISARCLLRNKKIN